MQECMSLIKRHDRFYSALDNMRSLKHFFIDQDQDQTQDIEESETESMQMV